MGAAVRVAAGGVGEVENARGGGKEGRREEMYLVCSCPLYSGLVSQWPQ